MHEPSPAYVALGSNLDDPVAQIRAAIEALRALPGTQLRARSRMYANPPMGPQNQPDFVNAVILIETVLEPHELLDALQAIETTQGRKRTGERWGSRTLDLDMLLYGDVVMQDDRLILPHPGLHERDFVLYPLAEIAPQLVMPNLGPLSSLLAQCPARGLRPLEHADE